MKKFVRKRIVKDFHKLWSVWGVVGGMAVNGALLAIPAFQDMVNPWVFLGLNVGGYAVVGVLRIFKQDVDV